MKQSDPKTGRMAPLKTPTDLGSRATKDLSAALNLLLADEPLALAGARRDFAKRTR